MTILHILTLFPAMFHNFLSESIPYIAQKKNKLHVNLIDIRDFSESNCKQVDDYQYGGGAGMVIKPEPLANAIEFVLDKRNDIPIIYFTPQGRLLKQGIVKHYVQQSEMIVLCGHYKDIDFRIRELYVTDEISIGDYVVSGGELPAMIFIDSISRLLDGVLNDIESSYTDSHETGLLGYPCYTRPYDFKGMTVPEILCSGHHKKIEEWRIAKALERTQKVRPELLDINTV